MPGRYGRKGRGQWRRRAARYAGYAHGAYSLAKAAYKGYKYVKNLVNVEYKFSDTDHNTSSLTPNSSGSLVNLTKIATGDDMKDREGRSIKLVSCLMRYTLTIHGSATHTSLRVMLIIDRDYLAALPSVTDVLSVANVRSPLNIFTTAGSRFKVLTDKVFTLDQNNRGAVNFKIFKKIHTHVKYGATTAADNAGLRGQLLLLTISNESTNTPTMAGYTRVRWIDN